MAERRQTALGVARARFVEGLPRKAREVRASLALLAATPGDPRSRDELRRRLHALYASAQVFRIGPLTEAVKEAVERIDGVRRMRRSFTQDELDELANLAATIPALGRAADAASEDDDERANPPSQPPRPQVRRGVDTVVSVLVVDTPQWQARVRAALPPESFEVVTAEDADEALRLARSGSPDLVLADHGIALRHGVDLIGRLREDPLTDFVPVILLEPPGSPIDPIAVREAGADEALAKPFDAMKLYETVRRVSSTLAGPHGASTLTGDLTVEEIAKRLAEELHRGLVGSTASGQDVAVPLGDGTPLLAAAWSAIGRIRAHLAERSGGRVKFRESAQRGGPSFVSVVGELAPDDDDDVVDLGGRLVLVVDDDPAVVWFFAGLLREHGAHAIEAEDGIDALAKAHANRPDLILSDILMPRLDGFGLTRALERDPLLADVPVILLSWKEDLLQRMRQLKAGASGYLRKEAGSTEILAAIRAALRPRARVESRLEAGGDVRGRLEEIGVTTLLTTVARLRPDARVAVRDPASLYEVDLRDGEIVDVTRTARDGGFERGEAVLVNLLGATTGRYTVVESDSAVRNTIEKTFEEVMREAIAELAARVDAVSGKNLSKAVRVDLDESVMDVIMSSSPEVVERVVTPLRGGIGPRQLMMDGTVEPAVLESLLVELARQGAILRVVGPDAEDRIALAREARLMGLHPELSEYDDQGTLSWLPTEVPPELAPPRSTHELTSQEIDAAVVAPEDAPPPLPSQEAEILPASDPPPEPEPEPEPDPDPDPDPDPEPEPEPDEPDDDEPDDDELEDDEPEDDEPEDDEPEDDEPEDDEPEDDEEPVAAPDPDPDPTPVTLSVPPEPALVEREEKPLRVPEPRRIAAPERRAAAPADEEEGAMGLVGWALVALILGVVGFIGLRLFLGDPAAQPPTTGPLPPEAPASEGDDPAPHDGDDPAPTPSPTADQDPAPAPEPADPDLPVPYGREEPGIAVLGIDVGEGQGLLVVEPSGSGSPMQVQVGDRQLDLTTERVGLALDPGVHHLTFVRGDHTDFVWVAVRAGRTRFVPPLP